MATSGRSRQIRLFSADEEVHAVIKARTADGIFLYGRRMHETMVYWESARALVNEPAVVSDFAELWRASDKIVYSKTLETVSSLGTPLERDFDLSAIRELKPSAERDVCVGDPELAAYA